MNIRRATKIDWERITSLIKQHPEVLVQDHLPEPEEFFVAEDPSTDSASSPQAGSGQVIGCCALEVYSKRLAEIRSLAVAKDRQGKGIGTALIEHCLEEAKKQGVGEILVITSALPLFEKHGFGTFKGKKYALIKVLN